MNGTTKYVNKSPCKFLQRKVSSGNVWYVRTQ